MSKHKSKTSNLFKKITLQEENYDGYLGIVYTRVSSPKQEIEGNGHESQKKRCVELLNNKGVPYQLTFKDTYSGGGDYTKRQGLMELFAYIDNHPHKKFVVIFDDLKRFARDVENHIKLRAELKIREVKLLCANHTFEDTPEGEAMELMSAVFAQYDRKSNRRQVVQKQIARLESGYRAFPAALGYTKVKSKIHGYLDTPNEKSKYIKEALEGFASMRFIHKIDAVRFLQENRVISDNQSSQKGIATFDKMLREKFYIGIIEYLPWEVVNIQGNHEAIITIDTYEKNQKRLSQRPGTFIRQDTREGYELRGFINCSECGVKLTGAPSTNGKVRKDGQANKKYDYYKCRNKECSELGKSIPTNKIDADFEKLVRSIKPKTEVISLATAILKDVWREEIENQTKIKQALNSRKSAITADIESFVTLIPKTKNETVISQYEKQIEKLSQEEESIDEELLIDIDLSIPNETSIKEVLNVLLDPYSVWKKYNIQQKQRFYNFIFEGNLVYSKNSGFETPNYALPIRLFEEISTTNSVNVEVGGIEPPCKE